LSKSERKLPQVVFGCQAPFDSPAFRWRDSDVEAMLAAKGFRVEPADPIYLRHINQQGINLAFVVRTVFIFF
jgi:hypothetical protein